MWQAVGGMSVLLVIFIGVLGLSYVATKKLADLKQGGVGRRNLQIVEVLPLAGGQYLYIVKVGQEHHLFSGTKETLNHCFKVEEGSIKVAGQDKVLFEEYLKNFIKTKEE